MEKLNFSKDEIEKGRFKIVKEKLKPCLAQALGTTQAYFLIFKGRYYFFKNQGEIIKEFRSLLGRTYEGFFIDYPDSFFKRYIHNKFIIMTKRTEKARIKKKPYYEKMRIERKQRKITRLKEEIKALRSEIIFNNNQMKGGNTKTKNVKR